MVKYSYPIYNAQTKPFLNCETTLSVQYVRTTNRDRCPRCSTVRTRALCYTVTKNTYTVIKHCATQSPGVRTHASKKQYQAQFDEIRYIYTAICNVESMRTT